MGRGMGMAPGGKAKMMARAAEAQPKMPRGKPAGATATLKASKGKAPEMGSGGLKAGINALKSNLARNSGKGGKMA